MNANVSPRLPAACFLLVPLPRGQKINARSFNLQNKCIFYWNYFLKTCCCCNVVCTVTVILYVCKYLSSVHVFVQTKKYIDI